MEVEEDPSSQFVDFTNATSFEQFVSDIEQTLISWHLANKGHASTQAHASALSGPSRSVPTKVPTSTPTDPTTSTPPPLQPEQGFVQTQAVDGTQQTQTSPVPAPLPAPAPAPTSRRSSRQAAGARSLTRVLEFDASAASASSVSTSITSSSTARYALTLFLSAQPSVPSDVTAPVRRKTQTQWQQGREHFTPTMLAIADASRDMPWWRVASTVHSGEGAEPRDSGSTEEDEDHREETDASTSSSWRAQNPQRVAASWITRNTRKWFGVDEFLFLSRTSLPSDRHRAQSSSGQRTSNVKSTSGYKDDGRSPSGGIATARGGIDETWTGADDWMRFDSSMDPNEASLVLSAVHLALNSCNCSIPVFVPVYDVARGTWLGSAVPGSTGNVSLSFETDSVPEVNSNQSCISGLIDFFQVKLQLPAHVEEQCRLAGGSADDLSVGMWVSAAFRYVWQRDDDPREPEQSERSWRYASGRSAKVIEHVLGKQPAKSDYWGTATSPVLGMELTAIWPNLREGTYVDNAVHSTLDAHAAPEWNLRAFFHDAVEHSYYANDPSRKVTMPVSRLIANLVQAYSKSRELGSDVLLSELAPSVNLASTSQHGGQTSSAIAVAREALAPTASRLPDSIPAARAAIVLGNAIGSITSSIVSAATWKGTDIEEIRRAVAELFDEEEASTSFQVSRSSPSQVKHGSPVGELVSVLSCRMGQLHGINAMSLLWVEFVKALRDRWDQLRLLPLMNSGSVNLDGSKPLDASFLMESGPLTLPDPDFHQCLLYQKLQLLNCCILKQIEHSQSKGNGVAAGGVAQDAKLTEEFLVTGKITDEDDGDDDDDGDDGSPSDDEFFDTVEVQETAAGESRRLPPEGVKRPIPGVFCLRTNAMMMEPETQAAVPATEDIVKQQQELLSRLGVNKESAMLRQQIQSISLVSDMQSFKAANPDSCLADFVRWYSPKDWIEDKSLSGSGLPAEGKNLWWFEGAGMLSERMRVNDDEGSKYGHLWHRMWESCAPLPASKQKRLFDPVEESEKIYHYLETISPHEMFHQTLVGAISSCYSILETMALPFPARSLPTVATALDSLREQCNVAVSLLDDALAQSQVVLPTGPDQREEQKKAKSQLQVAFEMAIDACWRMTRGFEQVEILLSQSSALLKYLVSSDEDGPTPDILRLVDALISSCQDRSISRSHQTEDNGCQGLPLTDVLKDQALRTRIGSLVLDCPRSREPVHREYVLRCICPRPYLEDYFVEPSAEREKPAATPSSLSPTDVLDLVDSNPVVVNRMYASFTKHTVRFAFAVADSEF
ncbi:hypothetical protein PINS_up000902 [Pythium insidiosum]|nr:hypothetical protein PINS_up000902 [Pythium insidiosum]